MPNLNAYITPNLASSVPWFLTHISQHKLLVNIQQHNTNSPTETDTIQIIWTYVYSLWQIARHNNTNKHPNTMYKMHILLAVWRGSCYKNSAQEPGASDQAQTEKNR